MPHLAALSGSSSKLYAAERPALDRAGEAAAGLAAAGVLLGPLRAAADGAVGLQPPVPLVRRPRCRRPGLGATVFTKNRDRLLEARSWPKFLAPCWRSPRSSRSCRTSTSRSTVRMIEAWASMKSFRPKDGSERAAAPGRNGERNFHGERRSNDTPCLDHRSGSQAVPQGHRQGSQALLHGPCADGEPARAVRRRSGQRSARAPPSATWRWR